MAAIVCAPSLCTTGTASGDAVPSSTSSFLGERVRVPVAARVAGKKKSLSQVVSAVQREQAGEKPWDTQQRAMFTSSATDSVTETSAVATDTNYSGMSSQRAKNGLFGYSRGTESEEEEESDEDEEDVLRVDNESVDDEDQLAIANLGIPEAVVESLAKRGISQLFPIQVTATFFNEPLRQCSRIRAIDSALEMWIRW